MPSGLPSSEQSRPSSSCRSRSRPRHSGSDGPGLSRRACSNRWSRCSSRCWTHCSSRYSPRGRPCWWSSWSSCPGWPCWTPHGRPDPSSWSRRKEAARPPPPARRRLSPRTRARLRSRSSTPWSTALKPVGMPQDQCLACRRARPPRPVAPREPGTTRRASDHGPARHRSGSWSARRRCRPRRPWRETQPLTSYAFSPSPTRIRPSGARVAVIGPKAPVLPGRGGSRSS